MPLEQRLAAHHAQEDKPWLLNFFAGVGAWFSALFLLPFFYLLDVFENAAVCGILGLVLFAAALALSRASRHVFLSQLSLSGLISGNFLTLMSIGLVQTIDEKAVPVMVFLQILLAAVTCLCFQGSAGRFLSLLAVPSLAVAWLFISEQPQGMHVIIGILALITGLLYSWENRPLSWDVAAWSAVLSLPATILLIELLNANPWEPRMAVSLWPSSVFVGLLLVFVVAKDAGGASALARPWIQVLLVAVLLLAAFTTPGILVAMVLVFLGRSRDEAALSGIGHVFFAAFLILFYYSLNVSLAEKSLLVTGSGVFLLLLRQGVRFHKPGGKEARA